MSQNAFMKNLLLTTVIAVAAFPTVAIAARGTSTGSSYAPAETRSSYRQEMMVDLSVHYVRDTKPDGGTDSAARFSLGGSLNEWVGLDVQALMEARSKDYLIGGDFKFVPVDWIFCKVGVGAYSQKKSHALALTPLAGAGIIARLNREYYFVTETSYFSVNDRNNIAFGVGFGMSF